jgi:hypothetical protein
VPGSSENSRRHLLARLVEVGDAVDEVLVIAGEWAQRARRGWVLFCGHNSGRSGLRM